MKCECGKLIGTNPECSFCKEFGESMTLDNPGKGIDLSNETIEILTKECLCCLGIRD